MIVIGLLLILVAAGAVVFALMAPSATSQVIELTAVGVKVSASPLAIFVAGAASVALLGLGFALVSRGARRSASSRKELRELRKDQAATAATAATAARTSAEADEGLTRGDGPGTGNSEDSSTGTESGKDTRTESGKDTNSGTDGGTDNTRERPLGRHSE